MVYLADLVLIAFSCLLTFAFGTHQTYGTSFIYTPCQSAFEFITYAVLAYVLGSSKYIIRLFGDRRCLPTRASHCISIISTVYSITRHIFRFRYLYFQHLGISLS